MNNSVFIVAEISCNHNQDINKAIKLIREAKRIGCDAVKIQCYTPDTITLNSTSPIFTIKNTIWDKQSLYDLYKKSYTPWEWIKTLNEIAKEENIIFFSSVFDITSVDFLEKEISPPIYKISSFELVDNVLLKNVAKIGKPIILSTGMATLEEIDEALDILVRNYPKTTKPEIYLLKCTSAYPASPSDANLDVLNIFNDRYSHIIKNIGLSDHTKSNEVVIAGVALGAKIIEKHIMLNDTLENETADFLFSLTIDEFENMIKMIRITEKTLGNKISLPSEIPTRNLRKSLFVVEDIPKNTLFTYDNIKSIRPAYGLHPRYYDFFIGKQSNRDIKKGEPLKFDMVI